MNTGRRFIEEPFPVKEVGEASAREKSIRHGYISTLHAWWAPRPLAACRAVLWSSLMDDPSEYMPDEASANEERERLVKILEDLVLWENVNNEDVLDRARLEIARLGALRGKLGGLGLIFLFRCSASERPRRGMG